MKTTIDKGHFHTISHPETGYTDITDGHKHKLYNCPLCDKIRNAFLKSKPTSFNKGHFHFMQQEII